MESDLMGDAAEGGSKSKSLQGTVKGGPAVPSAPDMSGNAMAALDDPTQFLSSMQRQLKNENELITANAEKRQKASELNAQNSQRQQALMGQAQQTLQQSKPQPYIPPDTRMEMGAWLGAAAAVAAAMSGRSRRSQMFAMTGFAGAVNGFANGKKEESERDFKVWQANQQVALQQNAQELQQLKLIMESNKLDYDQKMAQIELIGTDTQDKVLREMAYQKNFNGIAQYYDTKAQLHMKAQEASIKLATAWEKFQKEQGKSTPMNTPKGLQEFQQMVEAEKDPIKKKQLIWEFQMLHSGGAPGGQGAYPEPEAPPPKNEGGWLSKLFGGGGGATPAPAAAPAGAGASPQNPLPKPASAAELKEGMWYNMGPAGVFKMKDGKMWRPGEADDE